MTRELRELKRPILYKGKPTEIAMVEQMADENDAFVTKCTRASDGVINQAALWELRLSRTIKSPAELTTVAGIRDTTTKERTLLKEMWLALNNADKDDFLDHKTDSEDEKSDS